VKRYNKAIVAGVGFMAALLPLFGVHVLADPGVQNAIVALVTGLGVYLIPNEPA
jgi:energy-converting hydrogenase Eha subunit B